MIINPNNVGWYGKTIQERFWAKVDRHTSSSCWEWVGNKNKRGYGHFKLPTGDSSGGMNIHAHRYSYFLDTGHFPKTKEYICHRCDNPSCVNPDHLFLGTQLDNMRDMSKKGRYANMSGEQNPNSKLTLNDVKQIRFLYKKGFKYSYISKVYVISRTQFYRIINKESWKDGSH